MTIRNATIHDLENVVEICWGLVRFLESLEKNGTFDADERAEIRQQVRSAERALQYLD